jgi:D-arabinitol 2-dehydrogenase
MEKMISNDDVGHEMTGGNVGKHSKRTLASFSMEDKVCVVTGAARGLGNLMARTFIESGSSTVAILDLSQEEADRAAMEATEWFVEHGEADQGELNIIGVACDVADESSVQKAMDRVHSHYGRIDVVVNSAGIVENYPAEDYPTDRFKKVSFQSSSSEQGKLTNHCLSANGHQSQWFVFCRKRSSEEDVCRQN